MARGAALVHDAGDLSIPCRRRSAGIVGPCVAPDCSDGKHENGDGNMNAGFHQHKGEANVAPARALTIP